MRDRCPFPRCVLEEYHDDDHEFPQDEPHGGLRKLQEFATAFQRCEICPEMPAIGFFVDGRGKGWILCVCCEKEYSIQLQEAS